MRGQFPKISVFFYFILFIILIGLSGCGTSSNNKNPKKEDNTNSTDTNVNDDSSSDSSNDVNGTTSTSKRKWTYMVYMGADNNLSTSGIIDLNEMETVGSDENINIVLQAEYSHNYTDFNQLGYPQYDGQTLRFLVQNDNDPNSVNLGKGTPIGNLNMASPDTLKEFIIWAKSNYPADHYALVIWDHGAGWKESRLDKINIKGAVEDQTSNSFMTLPQLAGAVRDAGLKLDVINFDACLMAMYEVAYEFRGLTDYMTFSEETEPGAGDPYDTILSALNTNPAMSAKSLAATIVDKYYDYYNSPDTREEGITKSAVDMSQIDNLHSKVVQLADSILSEFGTVSSVVLGAQNNTQKYAYPANHDLYDFASYIEKNLPPGYTKTAAAEVKTAVANTVVANKSLSDKVKDSYGLAIYVPVRNQVSADESVNELQQYKDLASNNTGTGTWYNAVVKMTENISDEVLKTGGFAFYAEWDTDADVDMYVWEPCAPPDKPCEDTLYAAWMGQTTPNGYFSSDSYETGYSEEYYIANDYVEGGNYDVIINYVEDGTEDYANITLWYIDPSNGINDWVQFADQPVLVDMSLPYTGDFSDIQTLDDLNNYSNWWYPGQVTRTSLSQHDYISINSGGRTINFRIHLKKVKPDLTNLER